MPIKRTSLGVMHVKLLGTVLFAVDTCVIMPRSVELSKALKKNVDAYESGIRFEKIAKCFENNLQVA